MPSTGRPVGAPGAGASGRRGAGRPPGAPVARLLLLRPDLLLLDEPTNHLDFESLEWLEGFLASYDGSVVIVSHDRYFLNRMVTSIAELSGGRIQVYAGDYDHFMVEREARQALPAAEGA